MACRRVYRRVHEAMRGGEIKRLTASMSLAILTLPRVAGALKLYGSRETMASPSNTAPRVERTLRVHQRVAIEALRAKLRTGKKSLVLMAPCAFGKTTVASAMIQSATDKGKKAAFIVDRLELIDQASERFDEDGIQHGVIQADHPRREPWQHVQVCSIQTLNKRGGIDGYDLIIVDECHILHEAHKKIIRESGAVVIGLSATPFTKGLGKHFEDLVSTTSTADLIEQGFLCSFRVFAPSKPDLGGVKTVRGDYEDKGLALASDKRELIADIVDTWFRLGESRPTIAFAVNRAHSKHIAEQFKARGVVAEHLDCKTPKGERKEIINRYRRGEIKILVNVGILDKGFDYPGVSCVILARPTKSLMLHIQQIGRGLRTAEGKADCLILDHAGNHERMGFVTDDLPDALDMGTERGSSDRIEREFLPSACPKCAFMKPPRTPQCPICNYKTERQNTVETKDGKLVEVLTPKQRGKRMTMQQKASLASQLKHIGEALGYQERWSANAYRGITGTWPNHPSVNPRWIDAKPPTANVLSLINQGVAKNYMKATGGTVSDSR